MQAVKFKKGIEISLNTENNSSKLNFTKEDRILKRHEFIKISKEGRRLDNGHFLVIYTKGRQGKTRLGITVTKKVGNAVTRNRIKRLSREFFRQNRSRLGKPWNINIIAKKNAAYIQGKQVFKSLRELFEKIQDH